MAFDCYAWLQDAIVAYAFETGNRFGAFGHTPVSFLAYVGEKFLAQEVRGKPTPMHGEFVADVFSTYGRHDEELWYDVRKAESNGRGLNDALAHLCNAIFDGIMRLRQGDKEYMCAMRAYEPSTPEKGTERKGQ